jgi:disulfide bond formation protein DsbB
MKRLPDLLVLIVVICGGIYLFYKKAAGPLKIVGIILLIISLIGSITVFLANQENKTKL